MKDELRRLVIKTFHIEDVIEGKEVAIDDRKLVIPKPDRVATNSDSISEINLEIVKANYNKDINTIIDIIPISTKVLGRIGSGITHTLTGVYVLLTGTKTSGEQLSDFGSSKGNLNEVLMTDRAGTPDYNDNLILIDIKLEDELYEGRGSIKLIHEVIDNYIDLIRSKLKDLDPNQYDEKHVFVDAYDNNKKKIAIVKLLAGQGAMQDNLVLPDEPSGFKGGKSIIDLDHRPVIISPNEYRDGAIRAMT